MIWAVVQAVLAVVTVWLCVLSIRYRREARQTLDLALKLRETAYAMRKDADAIFALSLGITDKRFVVDVELVKPHHRRPN